MNGHLIRREELTAEQRSSMYRLLASHFCNVQPAQFERDLEDKNWVILLEDAGRVLGFSTLRLYQAEAQGDPVTVVYSGDTIVAREAWGSSVLSRTWITSVNHAASQYGTRRLFWLLITSGFRTYRFLPVFWREFFPRYDRPISPSARKLMDDLAVQRFGHRYDPAAGIVRLECPQPLQRELRDIPAERLKDEHVAFFARRNPGYAQGDELVCLTELSESNLTRAGRRMVLAGLARSEGKMLPP